MDQQKYYPNYQEPHEDPSKQLLWPLKLALRLKKKKKRNIPDENLVFSVYIMQNFINKNTNYLQS